MARPKGSKNRVTKIKEAKEFDKVIADAKQAPFKFHLNMVGEIFESEAPTALEALRKLQAPPKLINKAVLTISQGDKVKEILLTVPKLKRLFYPNFQNILIKNLVHGL